MPAKISSRTITSHQSELNRAANDLACIEEAYVDLLEAIDEGYPTATIVRRINATSDKLIARLNKLREDRGTPEPRNALVSVKNLNPNDLRAKAHVPAGGE
jgi:hypothetical protein